MITNKNLLSHIMFMKKIKKNNQKINCRKRKKHFDVVNDAGCAGGGGGSRGCLSCVLMRFEM